MKKEMNYILILKKGDAGIQITAFATLAFTTCLYPAYIIYFVLCFAVVQILSCLAWSLIFAGDAPRLSSGTLIRRAFLLILALTAIATAIELGALLCIGMIMLFIGPVLGLAYFVITLAEISYYSKTSQNLTT